jgi:methylated-DNA-[protein]-cysteine S-methyltransferase
MEQIKRAVMDSPVGTIIIETDGDVLTRLSIATTPPPGESPGIYPIIGQPLLDKAVAQLTTWFNRERTEFDLPLAPLLSPRGEQLRAAILNIPYGTAASYGEVARIAHSGPRAIGQACRRNPFPIIIPCHRVIAAGQQIGHYSGADGIVTKKWLLNFESRQQGWT